MSNIIIKCPLCTDEINISNINDIIEHAKFHFNNDIALITMFYCLVMKRKYPMVCQAPECHNEILVNPLRFDYAFCDWHMIHKNEWDQVDLAPAPSEFEEDSLKGKLLRETVKVYKKRNRDYREFVRKNYKDGVDRNGNPISREQINLGYKVFKCNLCGEMLNYSELMEHYKVHNMSQDDFFKQYQGLNCGTFDFTPKCRNCDSVIHFNKISFGFMNSTGFSEYCSDKCRNPSHYHEVPEQELGRQWWNDLCSGKLDKSR